MGLAPGGGAALEFGSADPAAGELRDSGLASLVLIVAFLKWDDDACLAGLLGGPDEITMYAKQLASSGAGTVY